MERSPNALLKESGPRSALMPILRPAGYELASQPSWQTLANVNGITAKLVAPER